MPGHRHLRLWDAVHRWTSLACTLFLLLLCLTGLPLIFHEEIDRVTQPRIHPDETTGNAPAAALDLVVAAAVSRHPTLHPLFASHEPHEPRVWYVTLASVSGDHLEQVAVDARSAKVLGKPHIGQQGVMGVIHSLHVDLFAGLKGKLFLGVMGILFFASIVSGAMLYAPFMRRREFGAIRRSSGTRSRWLDVHNLLGIATLLWASVVAFTGVINTTSDLLLSQWRSQMLLQVKTQRQAHAERVPAEVILQNAMNRLRDGEISFIAFPGSSFAGESIWGVYERGDSALTSRLVRPILLDAGSGDILSEKPLPWYLTVLLLSEPLHFGDYGELPLKILWAALDVLIIVILASGVYLWVARKRRLHLAPMNLHKPAQGAR